MHKLIVEIKWQWQHKFIHNGNFEVFIGFTWSKTWSIWENGPLLDWASVFLLRLGKPPRIIGLSLWKWTLKRSTQSLIFMWSNYNKFEKDVAFKAYDSMLTSYWCEVHLCLRFNLKCMRGHQSWTLLKGLRSPSTTKVYFTNNSNE